MIIKYGGWKCFFLDKLRLAKEFFINQKTFCTENMTK